MNEVMPSAYDTLAFTYLSDRGGLWNRHLLTFDSVVSHIDTTIHYRYVTDTERLTDHRRSILEQDFPCPARTLHAVAEGRVASTGSTRGASVRGTALQEGRRLPDRIRAMPGEVLTDDLTLVVKGGPQALPQRTPDDGTSPTIASRTKPTVHWPRRNASPPIGPVTGGSAVADGPTVVAAGVPGAATADSTAAKPFVFPEQRNYNVNSATDQAVLTQLGNAYSDQFYQPFTGPEGLKPGLSGSSAWASATCSRTTRRSWVAFCPALT